MLPFSTVVFLMSSSVALGQPLVKTYLGNVHGYHKSSYDGRIYSAFEGIPYAHPPIGELRFEEPVEILDPWKQTLDANRTYVCPQIYDSDEFRGTEDCLYLNVYVPRENPNPNDNLDVIVFIFGGSFEGGYTDKGGPGFFMDREVTFVNLNYRVDALGFLSTEDDVVPGNNGLKDQVMALKWIQNHIKQFGGNPKSVTITGPSAGACSVHFHYFSKLSQGLFHRGISQSGSALSPLALQTGALERVKALRVLVGCSDVTNRILIDCMKRKSAEEILENVKRLKDDSPHKDFPESIFSPIVEKQSNTSFLHDYPYHLLLNKTFNDLPWMTSICTEEGGILIKKLYTHLDTLDDKFNKWAHYYMNYNYTACKSDREFIAKEIREKYFGKDKMGRDTYKSIIRAFGDRLFTHSSEKCARLQASVANSKVYFYVYGYKNSFADDLTKASGVDLDTGVCHTEDEQLIYYVVVEGHQINANLSRDDEMVKNMMIDMYVSFANSSIPKINGFRVLPVSKSDQITFVHIKSPTEVHVNVTEEFAPTKFWNSLPIIELERFPKESCRKKPSNSNTLKSIANVTTGKPNVNTILVLSILFLPLVTVHFLLSFSN